MSIHFPGREETEEEEQLSEDELEDKLQEFGEYELFVDGKKDEEIQIQFTSVVGLKRIGRETRFRPVPAAPRFPDQRQQEQSGLAL